MSAAPVIVRYRGLLLALTVLFALLTLLAIPTMIALGQWILAATAVVSLVASMLVYGLVRDYE